MKATSTQGDDDSKHPKLPDISTYATAAQMSNLISTEGKGIPDLSLFSSGSGSSGKRDLFSEARVAPQVTPPGLKSVKSDGTDKQG